MNQDKHKEKFPGFPPEPTTNFWRYPKCLNGWWHMLSGTEQKVLDYIVRHTWGYNKTADRISISQFKAGIKNRKTGEWVDKGIGIKKNDAIIDAINRLEDLGFIKTNKKAGKATEIQLLTNGDTTIHQKEMVGIHQREDTINDITINNKQNGSFHKNKKPFYKGDPVVWSKTKKKWFVINKFNDWLEFAGNFEKDIEWM